MRKLQRLRKRVGYEKSVPRCDNCTHYRRPGTFLINSLPRNRPALCVLHDFTVKPMACCDKWHGSDGTTLAELDEAES